jgi:predicted nucleic acid-binding Zn ribbon protein
MKGNCDLVKCQICQQEMSFGRIKRHINTQHKNITVDQYIIKYWSTLPLHKPCEICKENIVYKYKTCSKECHAILKNQQLKGVSKPKEFMDENHKQKISKSKIGTIVSKETGNKISKSSKGVSRNKGKQPMLGKHQSNYQKDKVRQRLNKFYQDGGESWTKNNKHTPETIEKIFTKRPMNKLEKLVQEVLKERPGLWANIRAKRERGESPASKGSKAYKTAVKAGKEINKKND